MIKNKPQTLTTVEKKILATKVSHIAQKQLKNSLRPTVQYIKKSFMEELLNELKKSSKH